jgi:hypothetical protein
MIKQWVIIIALLIVALSSSWHRRLGKTASKVGRAGNRDGFTREMALSVRCDVAKL